MEKIVCPHCNKEVELSQAIFHEVEEKVSKQKDATHKRELETVVKEAEERLKKEFESESSYQLKSSQIKAEQLDKSNAELRSQLLELNKTIALSEEARKNMQLELERTAERTRKETQENEAAKHKLELEEKDKKISDMQKALEEAQRKGKQGSQQLQGEVLELNLEAQLGAVFPEDEILPVPKGVHGADLLQKVRNKTGKSAGIIIWEAKRAKWADSWIQKLKDDMISAKANEALLVVEELPDKISRSGFIKGVWVASYKDALTIANSIRILLMKLAQTKASEENKDEKLEDLYQFISSDNFKHRISAYIETVNKMKEDLDSARRLQERGWKRREVEINRLGRLNGIFDEITAISGINLPLLQSSEGDSEEAEELKLLDE